MTWHQYLARLVAIVHVVMAAICWPTGARGEVRPNALISDGMVLQRDRPLNVWGTADPGESVAVEFRGREVTTTADSTGRWSVLLDKQSAGGPFSLTIAGRNTVTLGNVLVGDVWVCSGQSNMGWPLASRPGSKELIGTENPQIRLFTVPASKISEPQAELKSQWHECGPNALLGFSAVAYYFGRQIQQTQHVPIGLIHSSYGGSGIESWISAGALAEKKGAQSPLSPRDTRAKRSSHSQLYNGMIAPLLPYGIRGVLWYQGEADVSRAADYRSLLSTLIHSWRREWAQGEFPFLLVQLAPFHKVVDQPQDSELARLREAQWQTSLTIADTGMAVITDWGHETDIHVKQKRPVGERLALLARALVYHERVTYSGPIFVGMQRDGPRLILRFEHIGSGLVAKRMELEGVTKDGRSGVVGGALHIVAEDDAAAPVALQGFMLAGNDRRFVPATAEIRGATVVVQCPQVLEPVAVRFGWADYPTGNLFNVEGLPATPFRTDDWPSPAESRPKPRSPTRASLR